VGDLSDETNETERLLEQLEVHNAELVRSNRDLDDFAYVASHDLRSPLMVVQGYLDLLCRTKDHLLDDEARLFVKAALDGSERMVRLIDDLLLFSRAGLTPCEFERVDLTELASAVVTENVGGPGERNGAVQIDGLPVVLGDKTMLRQLFQNLLSNAMKFVAPDTTPHVVLGADRDAEFVYVADNGIGIPESERERVFQMLTRVDPASDRPGSGIGLAVCDRVVRAHGGELWVEDGDDGGSRFCFTLPLP
jgi:signal transduction histidine kinase